MAASAVILVGTLSVVTFAACTGGSSPPPAGEPPTPTMETDAPPTESPQEAPEQAGPPKEPETQQDCENLVTELTNLPPEDGVVMNNAMTSGDAGSSDRLKPILDVMAQHRDAFRCCFDIWGKKNPGQEGKVAFVLDLRPSGELRKAEVKHDESDLHAQEVEKCMVAVAEAIPFPESPSGKDTSYTHRFNFKARN